MAPGIVEGEWYLSALNWKRRLGYKPAPMIQPLKVSPGLVTTRASGRRRQGAPLVRPHLRSVDTPKIIRVRSNVSSGRRSVRRPNIASKRQGRGSSQSPLAIRTHPPTVEQNLAGRYCLPVAVADICGDPELGPFA